jgi:uncharacterized delta-60 repeat protein
MTVALLVLACAAAAVGHTTSLVARENGVRSGGNGWVTTAVGPGVGEVSALVEQPDGKLIAAGGSEVMGAGLNVKSAYLALVRYQSGGSLDGSFGRGGTVRIAIGRFTSGCSLVREPNGKLVVAGVSGASHIKLAVVRLNPNGSFDASFGRGGIVTTAIGGGVGLDGLSASLVREPDGKLVVASLGARAGSAYFVLARYNPDGSLDTSFGHGGTVATRVNGLSYTATRLVLRRDGKLVVAAGTYSAQPRGGWVLARYNPDGSLDRSFGHGGKVTGRGTTDNDTYAGLALLPGGRLVAAGAGSYSALTLAAYDENGKSARNFGRHGRVTTILSPAGSISYDGVLIAAPDGKLVAASAADLGPNGQTGGSVIVRYNSNGSLDSSFGVRGRVVTTTFAGGLAGALLRQQDGKLVVAGGAARGPSLAFALARFEPNGSPDTSFGPSVATGIASASPAGRLVLRPRDLPGFTVKTARAFDLASAAKFGNESPALLRSWGFVAAYLISFIRANPSHKPKGVLAVFSSASVYRTTDGARKSLEHTASACHRPGFSELPVSTKIGDEAHLCAYRHSGSDHHTFQYYVVAWRDGPLKADVITGGLKGRVTPTEAVTLAKLQDTRMH